MYVRKSRQLGGILLVSGTTIGAGMLALPVLTGIAGFYPSVALFIFYWLLSVVTALLMLEVNLWFREPVNLITMSKYTLGKKGEISAWILYLLLLYSLTAAYLAASGSMFEDFVHLFSGVSMPPWILPLPFLIIFGVFIFMGTRPVDYVNRALMIGLVIAYIALLTLVSGYIDKELLSHASIPFIVGAVPVVVTSFGFHIVIPSLTNYLHKNVKVLKRVILIGSGLPLIVYLLWEAVVVGSVPLSGEFGLESALQQGQSATYSLTHLIMNPTVSTFARLFSFFAIVTSFLGVGLSLSHFLADGFRIHPNTKGRIKVAALTFIPPLFFTLTYPQGFIMALDYAGVFVALLLGILPCLMAWRGRIIHTEETPFKVFGGRSLLSFVIIAYLFVIVTVFL